MASDAENNRLLKQAIIQCLQEQEQSLAVFRNLIENKDVIIFLGNTRSGKSTLVNYIIGNQLEGWETGKMEFKIRLQDEDVLPEIGHGSLSCTSLPGVYQMQGSSDIVVVDPPGFEDNRGIVQDIINSLCISQIKAARTVKFVLVFDINEITSDNIRNFTNSVQQVQALVCNFDELKNSFSFIFTKDWKNFTQTEIGELFRNKILNEDQLDVNKVLIRNVAENQKFIGIFKMPTRAGDVSLELDINVKGAIRECHGVDVEKCQIMFALSDKAQEALLQVYPEYTDTNYFEEEVNKITEMYNNYFRVDKYVFASYDGELSTTKKNLETIASALMAHQHEDKSRLYEIQGSLDHLLETASCSEFKASFKFVIMLDESSMLEERYKMMIITNYTNSLSKLYVRVTELLAKIDAEIADRRKNKILFTGGGLAAVVGVGPALAGAAQVVDRCVKTGNALKTVASPGVAAYGACEAAIGGAATIGVCVVGAAVAGAGAGSTYVLYKQTYGKRIEARRAQNRL